MCQTRAKIRVFDQDCIDQELFEIRRGLPRRQWAPSANWAAAYAQFCMTGLRKPAKSNGILSTSTLRLSCNSVKIGEGLKGPLSCRWFEPPPKQKQPIILQAAHGSQQPALLVYVCKVWIQIHPTVWQLPLLL